VRLVRPFIRKNHPALHTDQATGQPVLHRHYPGQNWKYRQAAQMMTAATFAGWDLATTGGSNAVWRVHEGHSAPLLRTLMTNLTVTANNVTNIYTGASYTGGAGVTYSSPRTSRPSCLRSLAQACA
jgi:hypothetical protein